MKRDRERRRKSLTIEEFTRAIESFESIHKIPDCIYEQCVKELGTMKVSQLNEISVTRVLKPFLLDWGRMGRVLGSEGPKAINRKIKSIGDKIEPLRKGDLFSIDLEKNRSIIIELFDEICGKTFKNREAKVKRIGPTAASKVLHLLCPDLFMMWDSKIRIKYGQRGVGADYFEFLKQMKHLGVEVKAAIQHLERKYVRRPTKLLDQYNWKITHS